ncbi:hypothetical protein FZC76_20060 [Sutcliffiella horikoshii]|uniref:Uncharacterized protein n=1 Tax=Sutcliffiella horikoshii TaxID=79883 RepID=A0A5D4SMJ1_9BACI|nr:hypothetical protein [Sutcliffiella horikoshii]TYS63514.1 hypothetical protein FZC76_20060 [Sutcliffiella horikoshii]
MENWIIAIFTMIYVVLTYLILKSNKKMIEENVKGREREYRPEVIGFFREERGFLYFQLKNIGRRLAINTQIDFIPDLNMWTYMNDVDFLKGRIKTIAPNQFYDTYVGVQHEVKKEYEELLSLHSDNKGSGETFIKIKYNDEDGINYESYYEVSLLDFDMYKGRRTYDMTDLVKEIKALNEKNNKEG